MDATVVPFRVVTDDRAERSELVATLVGALAIISGIRDSVGRAYRADLARRIRSILDRENR